MENEREFVINEYKNEVPMAHIAKKIGVTPATIKNRLVKWGEFNYNKKITLKEKCLRSNVSYGAVLSKCKKYNLTQEEAIEEVKAGIKRYRFPEKYKEGTMTRECYLAGLNYRCVLARMRNKKESVKEAIDYLKKRRERLEAVHRECELKGLNHKYVLAKMNTKNISLEEAIEEMKYYKTIKRRVVRKKENEVRMIEGLSLKEYAEKYGMSLSTARLHWRILNEK